MINGNDLFNSYKNLIVHSSKYITVDDISYSRAQYYKEVFFCKEYPSFIKKYPKAVEKLRPEEFYSVDVFFIPDIELITTEDCLKFAEQYSGLLVGVQGVSGYFEKIEESKKSTIWLDPNNNFWSPKIFDNPGNSFEFNLGSFNFDRDDDNLLIIFYQID